MDLDRKFLDQFDHYFRAINEALTRPLGTRISVIENIGRHSLSGEGKRLRPLLFVLSSQLCGYPGDDSYHVSTIFEYVHTASLLHDDVLDNAEIRRRKPSVRHIWGNSAAILGGDYLYAKASAVAIEANKSEINKVLSDTSARMVEGQFLELDHTHNWQISRDEYMEIIISKTAVLMAAACACGGILAGAEKQAIEHLRDFGLNLGIAFQLIDDVLDYTSCEEEFGKPVGKDLREGKITLPLIYALHDLEIGEVERLADLFKNCRASDEDYARVITMVRNDGIIERIRSEAKGYADKAAGSLGFFPHSSVRASLLALNAYVTERSF